MVNLRLFDFLLFRFFTTNFFEVISGRAALFSEKVSIDVFTQ